MEIKRKHKKKIIKTITELFDKLQARLLGRLTPITPNTPRIVFNVINETDPLDTLEGLHRYTASMIYGPQVKIDEDVLKDQAEITHNYIEAKKRQFINKLLADLDSAQNNKDVKKAINTNLREVESYIKIIVTNEAKQFQSSAERVGIEQVAASMGIDDPTVAKLGVYDNKTCKDCIQLWHLDRNPAIPKVYKLSELREGYMIKRKGENPYPTVGPTHPNCRHILVFVPPSMGFDESGKIHFKYLGYDEYSHQRGK